MAGALQADLDEVYRRHRRHLWGLCYRMTGSASDADDLVQDTFARALARPPRDTARDWRPWLVRVAVNLSRDHLRRRRRSPYVGPWLPEPVLTHEGDAEPAHEPTTTEGRYELLESCSYAFLVALEALSPSQRAVLLLRDVFEYSGAETAAALDLGEANVRQLLHRAREALARYDARRRPVDRALREETGELLSRLLLHVARQDVAAVEELLAEDVVALTDGAGRYAAARRPIVGRAKVARTSVKLYADYDEAPAIQLLELNGLPALVGRFAIPRPGRAPAFAQLVTPDGDGRLVATHTLLAPAKLAAVLRAAEAAGGAAGEL